MSLLIFDLDGTLIDSRRDLANSVNATRAEFGKGPLLDEVIFSYVGNGAPVLIQRSMGPEATEAELRHALEFFYVFYRKHSIEHTVLYPGVREALNLFSEAGHSMAVLTNKPVRISRSIVEALGVAPLFFQVYGGNSFEPLKKPDPIGIFRLQAEAPHGKEDTWMVGDSSVDVQTARNAGVRCCGVTFGFQPETFRDYPPDVLVDRLEDFAAHLIR